MSHLGISVMLNQLGGNLETVQAFRSVVNRAITKICFSKEKDALFVCFDNRMAIKIWDDGQSCCESRYMVIEEDTSIYLGSLFLDLVTKNHTEKNDEAGCDCHEEMFVDFVTSNGSLQIVTHNEHNGYYGGFSLCMKTFFEEDWEKETK